MSWQVEVDQHACIGSGMCAALAPEWFALDGEHATALATEVEPHEILLDVADSCPATAITITDGGNEVGPRP
jgi:ferredoxin